MRHGLRLFFTALEYLTRVPKPRWVGFDPAWLPASMRYLPLVGVVVGAISATVFWLAGMLWPHDLAVLMALGAGMLATGALHEDGLADTFDAMGAYGNRPRMLAIMQDSRLGTFGVAGLVCVLLARLFTLEWLPAPWVIGALLVGHTWSRVAPLAIMASLTYVRADGPSKARPLTEGVGWNEVGVGVMWALLLLGLCTFALVLSGQPWWSAAPLLVGAGMAVLGGVLAGIWIAHRLGGYTGDTLGAVQQCGELTCYLAMVALARAWSGDWGGL